MKPFGLTTLLSPCVPSDCSDYAIASSRLLCPRNLSILSHLRNIASCNMNITPGIYKPIKSFANKWDKLPRPNPSLAEVEGNCDSDF